MGTKDIFISYKAEEYEEAEWVRSTLEYNGISCWMAPECIAGGSNYAREIPKAIRECRVFVLILSEKSQGSQWVPRELDQAINEKKTIMPFMLENCALRDDFSFYLSNVQRYEAYANKSAAMEKMVREIRALIQAETEHGRVPEQKADKTDEKHPQTETADVMREENPAEEKKKRTSAVIAGIAAAVLILAAALYAGMGGTSKEQTADAENTLSSEKDAGGQSAETGEGAADDTETEAFRHIRLMPPEDMSVKEFGKAVEILEGRLDLFSDGEYEMQVGTDVIDLVIPKKAFGTLDVDKVLQCYITRAVNLYGFTLNEEGSAAADRFEISRKDLEEVTLLSGTIDGVDPADYGVDTEEYQYVKIVLTDACASGHAEEIAAWGDGFAFGQDMASGSNFWSYYTFPEGDGKTFYVLNNDLDGNYSELLVHNLTHDALASSFFYLNDLNESADWENPADAQVKGENQRGADEITGKSVTFTLNAYEILTAGEWLDLQTVFKERLDLLDQPYAFGKTEDREEEVTTVYIKTGVAHMGIPIMKILGSYGAARSVSAQSGFMGIQGIEDFRMDGKGDGTYEVTVNFPSISSENEEESMDRDAFWESSEDGTRLLMNGECFFGNDRNRLTEDGSITFDRLICLENQKITEENLWMPKLLECLVKDTDMPCGLYLEQYWMNEDQNGEIVQESEFAVSYASEVDRAADAVRELVPDAEVSNDGMTIYMDLNLDVDETLPEEGIRLVREIYENMDFEHSIFRTLWIYLIEEDNEARERARIHFDKSYSSGLEEPGVVYGGLFTNGRLEKYKERYKALMEAEPFYVEREDRSEWGGFRYEWN